MTQDYLDEKVAPKREDRLGACTAFGGSGAGLRKKWCAGCMQHNSRGFCQGSICQLMPAMSILSTIPDSVMIIHGSVGCGGPVHSFNASVRSRQLGAGSRNPSGAIWVNTNLTEADVVSGGETKLREAVLEADKHYHPAAILITVSCVPGIIGDDVEGLAASLQPQVNATLVPIHCEGFKTKVMATAYDSVYHGVVRHLLKDAKSVGHSVDGPAESDGQSQPIVNLMNVSSMGEDDEAELSRLLSALGLAPQIFPCWAHPDHFGRVKSAAVSISTCPTHDDYFLSALEQQYGIPSIITHMPIGIEATSIWLRAAAKFFGLEAQAEKLIEQEVAELEAALEPLLPILSGKRAIISAGEVRALGTGTLLHELGIEVLAVRPYHFDEFGLPALGTLEKAEPDIEINVGTVQPFETANLLLKHKPDVFMGHVSDNVTAARAGVPTLPIYGGPNTYLGYKGVFDIARRLTRTLGNTSFSRNLAQHTRLPYKQSWLEQDPYRFIVESVDELG